MSNSQIYIVMMIIGNVNKNDDLQGLWIIIITINQSTNRIQMHRQSGKNSRTEQKINGGIINPEPKKASEQPTKPTLISA